MDSHRLEKHSFFKDAIFTSRNRKQLKTEEINEGTAVMWGSQRLSDVRQI